MVKTAEMTSEMLIGELQRQLEDQHNRIVELVSEMERYKLESVQLRQHLEEQQQIHRKSLLKEQESHKQILEKVDSLQLQAKELMDQLEKEKHEVLKLQREKENLKETVQALQQVKQVRSEEEAENQLDSDVAVTQKIPQTKNTCNIGLSADRTKNWIMHQKLAATENGKDASVFSEQWYTESVNGTEIDGGGSASGENINMERIRQKMQLIISKLRMMANKVTTRMQRSSETTDDDDLIWLQNNIQDIALQLQQLQIPVPENIIPSSGSTAALTERLLKQNADLTSFVSRLTEEKNDLHNSLLKLQEEVRKYRQRSWSSDQENLECMGKQNLLVYICFVVSIFEQVLLVICHLISIPLKCISLCCSPAVFILIIILSCCDGVRRKAPWNIMLLLLFTILEGLLLGAISVFYRADAVMWAVGATAFVSLGLTLFSLQTKWDFTAGSGVLFVVLLVLVAFGILCAIIQSFWLQIVYASLGTLIFSIYLVVDTQLMLGGKHRYSLSPEEYIFAALNLYLDTINLFLFILQIIGLSR
ncbi:A-kinase anchor protein 9-like [Rhincodon typus]|uniref:A-kinase anchor protein 9-like n=1 Tax=Rhincodon typus TaxID=259920 RepID=UPI002030F887|nr:A-kinase anchor protein 9-like [Rhincodon typus]